MILKTYDNTLLSGKQKKGILTPDSEGYRTIPLGALGCTNTRGEFYTATDEVVALFDTSATFMDLVSRGNLRAEREHPMPDIKEGTIDVRSGVVNIPAYIQRLRIFKPDRICAHIKNINLVPNSEFGSDEVEPSAIIILGDVKPIRDLGVQLEDAFNNPHENVSFSIRSLTTQRTVGNKTYKDITEVLGFDWVTLCGIRSSHKYNAPGLESGMVITTDMVDEIVHQSEVYSLESDQPVVNIDNLVKYLKSQAVDNKRRKSRLETWR